MTLPLLPGDYAPDDTPTAAELNAMLAHLRAANVEQYNTIVARTTLVQAISTGTVTPISWQVALSGRNGMGWSVGVPTRLTVPSGGGGLWEFVTCLRFANIATGYRIVQLRVDGATTHPGDNTVGSAAVFGEMTSMWHLDLTAGQYVEILVWQNSGGTVNLDVAGIAPQCSARRIAL